MWLNYVPLSLLLFIRGAETDNCQGTGEWAEWSDWSTCPQSASSLMNFQRRIRQCDPRPVGCTVSTSYTCPGNYSQVIYCYTSTAEPTTVVTTTPTTPSMAQTTSIRLSSSTTFVTTHASSTTAATERTTSAQAQESSAATTGQAETSKSGAESSSQSTNQAESTHQAAEKTTAAEAQGTTPETNQITTVEAITSQDTTIEATTSGGSNAQGTTIETTAVDKDSSSQGSTPGERTSTQAGHNTAESTSSVKVTTRDSVSSTRTSESQTTGVSASSEVNGATTAAGEESTKVLDEETTTVPEQVTCDDCQDLEVHLYDWDPFEDASSVLNRYTYMGCKYVMFTCRTSQKNDTRPVRTIYDGAATQRGNPNNALFACQNGLWIEQTQETPVSSLSCIYDVPPTTKPPQTTTPLKTATTSAPTTTTFGIDPHSPCFNCSYLVVSPPNNEEGYTYLDHRIGKCLSVIVYCRPLNPDDEVTLLIDGEKRGLSGKSINKTFYCNTKQQWVDDANEIIDSVACAEYSLSGGSTEGTTIDSRLTDSGDQTTAAGITDAVTTTPSSVESTAENGATDNGGSTIEAGGGQVTGEGTGATTDAGVSEIHEGVTDSNGGTTAERGVSDSSDGVTDVPSSEETTAGEVTKIMTTTIKFTEDLTGLTEEAGASTESGITDEAGGSTSGGVTGGQTSVEVTGESTIEATTDSGITLATEDSTNERTTPNSGVTDSGSTPGEEATTDGGVTDEVETTTVDENTEEVTEESTTESRITGETGSTEDGGITELPIGGSESTDETTDVGLTDLPGIGSTEDIITTTAEDISTDGRSSDSSEESQATTASNSGSTDLETTLDTGISSISTEASDSPAASETPSGGETSEKGTTAAGGETSEGSTLSQTTSTTPTPAVDHSIPDLPTVLPIITTTASTTITTPSLDPGGPTDPSSLTVSPHPSGLCGNCSNMQPVAITETPSTYNGMLILNHFTNTSGCRSLIAACTPRTGDTASLLFSNGMIGETGTGQQVVNFECTSNAQWLFEGIPVSSASCSANRAVVISSSTVSTQAPGFSPVVSSTATSTTTPVTTTVSSTPNPSLTACQQCGDLPIDQTPNSDFQTALVSMSRSTANSCGFLQFSCTGTTPTSNVAISMGGTILQASVGVVSMNMTCNSMSVWTSQNGFVVLQASCLETITITQTPPTTTATSITKNPSLGACVQCSNVTVDQNSQIKFPNGLTSMSRSVVNGCSSLQITCTESTPSSTVGIMSGGNYLAAGSSPLTIELTCNANALWFAQGGLNVNNISCIQSMTSAVSTSSTWTADPPSTTPTTTLPSTTSLAACQRCGNLTVSQLSGSINAVGSASRTLANGCSFLQFTCTANNPSNVATIFAGSNFLNMDIGMVTYNLTCNDQSVWTAAEAGLTVAEVNCIETVSSTTLPSTTTSSIPTACQLCSNLTINQTPESGFTNGLVSMSRSMADGCSFLQFSCTSTIPNSNVAIMMGGNMLDMASGEVSMNITCNEMSVWTSQEGIVILESTCIQTEPITSPGTTLTTSIATTSTPSSTAFETTTSSPTTATTTTPSSDPAMCTQCPNMEAVAPPTIGTNQDIGMLVLDHFYEPTQGCRVVVVRCKGQSPYNNMTIIFNGDQILPTTPLQSSTSLVCSSQGIWTRLEVQVTNVACLQNDPPPDVTFPPTPSTTLGTTTTTTLPPGVSIPGCTRCTSQPFCMPPTNYKSGFLTIDTVSAPNACLTVVLSCAAPEAGNSVALMTSFGTALVSATNLANATITCNNNAQWVTTSGQPITTLSCAYASSLPTAPTTISTPAQEPAATTTTLAPVSSGCSQATWNDWEEWSACTGNLTCGACQTHTRFRVCSTPAASSSCTCPGSDHETVPCNVDVCTYPNGPCCANYGPRPANGRFQCVAISAPSTTTTPVN